MSNSVWKGPFRYQLTYMGKSAGVMVSIVLLIQILFSAIAAAAEPGEPIYSNAQESSSMIYCFVLGCCMWKESFHLSMATGITRRGIFLASLTSLLTLCVVLVPVELLISFIANQFFNAPTLFFLIYGSGKTSPPRSQTRASSYKGRWYRSQAHLLWPMRVTSSASSFMSFRSGCASFWPFLSPLRCLQEFLR